MFGVSDAVLACLKKEFPVGTRVELVRMDDKYTTMVPGERGTVRCVDDAGTIHVNWDCGSSLGVVYGTDICKKIDV